MTDGSNSILAAAEYYITNFFNQHIAAEYVYHDLQHTLQVVESTEAIAKGMDLSETEKEMLELAAWFHDTGYVDGPEGHEERSCKIARQFLLKHQYPESGINNIEACIRATKVPQRPKTLLEEILCDADLSHLGNRNYWDRCGRVRQELLITRSLVMSEQEWVEFELDFMTGHQYHTEVAHELFDKNKQKHVRQLQKQQLRLNPEALDSVDDLVKRDKKQKKKKREKLVQQAFSGTEIELKQLSLGRGVETMFRNTYRTHINLSAIADNKANIMLSVNAVILSIVVSVLVPKWADNTGLIFPSMVLLLVCMLTVIFATLSTRPKVTEGVFTREDIEHKQSNLLFFGNFYKMKLDDFQWGMTEMIKDSDFLYSSMTRDLYYLGVVLAKKYRYLRICYNVFMYGMIAVVLAFALAFAL